MADVRLSNDEWIDVPYKQVGTSRIVGFKPFHHGVWDQETEGWICWCGYATINHIKAGLHSTKVRGTNE
mgnify:FL=1